MTEYYLQKYMEKTLSYNAPMTIAVGGNSIGKTYSFTYQGVKEFIKTGKQFGWIRRYDPELKKASSNFFDDLIEHDEFPGYIFKTDKERGYIAKKPSGKAKPHWQVCCHFFALSMQGSYKGTAYPRVKRLIFDEYIREVKTPPGYLYDDIGKLMKLWKTVGRKRNDCQLYLLSNAVDLVNPAFLWLGITDEPKPGYSWHNNKTVLLHHIKDAAFAQSERDTLVGKVIAGTELEKVMIDNAFAASNDLFIARKTANAKYRYGFKYRGHVYAIWLDNSNGLFYVNRKAPKGGLVYSLTTEDHRPNMYMVESAGKIARQIGRLYGNGVVRFENNAAREGFLKMLRMLGLR
jgi:hypothetical protein|nr:MAG TPA: DNA encapsidation protein [Caudoviricetes sp.]